MNKNKIVINRQLRILFIGDLNEYMRSSMRLSILKKNNFVISISNTKIPFFGGITSSSLLSRILFKLKLSYDEAGLNKKIFEVDDDVEIDLIWVEKSNMLKLTALLHLKKIFPKSVIISFSEDNMIEKHNNSLNYLKCLPNYDKVFTTKRSNLTELLKLGAKCTELFIDSYYNFYHFPMEEYENINNKDIDVSFIGTYEFERANSIKYLISNGINVYIYGSGWEINSYFRNYKFLNKPVYGKDYNTIMNRTKINLNFLRKINNDEITCRSFEIPGAGGFMISERTLRHEDFFKEGLECDYFSDNNELLEKVNYYLNNPKDIYRIGKSARLRSLVDDYSMEKQVQQIILSSLNVNKLNS